MSKPLTTQKFADVGPLIYVSLDPQEMMLVTIRRSLQRHHAILRIWRRHATLTRTQKIWTAICAVLTVMVVVTLLFTYEGASTKAWVAPGVVGGVVAFPILQLISLLYVCRPLRRVLSRPPTTASMPKEIKRPQAPPQVERAKEPALPTKVRP